MVYVFGELMHNQTALFFFISPPEKKLIPASCGDFFTPHQTGRLPQTKGSC